MASAHDDWRRELTELELELRCAEAALREAENRNRPDQGARSRKKIAAIHARINAMKRHSARLDSGPAFAAECEEIGPPVEALIEQG